ncbi:MAG: hypothetical protein H7325_09720 [Pedobacter sp.]|nr:hypothetical protein [Pedobacter sp.]
MKKVDIETQILAAILFNKTAYPAIAHILKPENFTSTEAVKHREIYKAIENLYPVSPIDLVTLHAEMHISGTLCDEAKSNLVYICGCGTITDANIKRWAFILLQESIRKALLDKLMGWREQRDRDFEKMEKEVLTEIWEIARLPDEDIFQIIEQALVYFQKIGMQPELEDLQEFQKTFKDRVAEIKRVSSIETALGFLLDIAGTAGNDVRYNCKKFALAIADMVTSGQSNESYNKAVNVLMGVN